MKTQFRDNSMHSFKPRNTFELNCQKNSARYEKLTRYFLSDREDRDDDIVACNNLDELNNVVDSLFDKEGWGD